MLWVRVLLAGVVVFAASACGSNSESTDFAGSQTTVTTVVSTTLGETTTTQVVSTTNAGEPKVATTDVLFMTQEGHELLVDVYVPEEGGPHSVVVAFHGLPSNKDENRPIGREFAESGLLTFVPTWLTKEQWTADPLPADLIANYEAATCILAFAQEHAERYGGDPTQTVVYGFSAGAQPAAWLGLGHTTDVPQGCVAVGSPSPPVGAVLGDSEYVLHSEFFDYGFATDPEGMQRRVADFVDPATWPDTLSAAFRVWSVEGATLARPIADLWDKESWLASRDPDGSIRTDLETLGLHNAGQISHIDEGVLLTMRLTGHGLDATHDLFPGGHESFDKLDDMVTYIFEVLAAQ
jgi:acetyl esterase/lipase